MSTGCGAGSKESRGGFEMGGRIYEADRRAGCLSRGFCEIRTRQGVEGQASLYPRPNRELGPGDVYKVDLV